MWVDDGAGREHVAHQRVDGSVAVGFEESEECHRHTDLLARNSETGEEMAIEFVRCLFMPPYYMVQSLLFY